MFKYRKKPVVIEAFQYFDKMGENTAFIPRWFIDATIKGVIYCVGTETFIKTLESSGNTHKLTDGDWVIKGVKDELYACKPDIFELTYERVDETTDGQVWKDVKKNS